MIIKHDKETCNCVLCHPSQQELLANTIVGNGLEKSTAIAVWKGGTGWVVDYTHNGIQGCMDLTWWNDNVRKDKKESQ